jgi:leader peptidase (prepilin peptidase)/N-methyltransferase
MTEYEIFWSVCFFLLGTIIGSFLNVCIVRLPHEKSVVFPASHCVKCQKPIAWYDNIPLVSYLILGGKCRHCQAKFSFRYFLVEFTTGLSFLLFYKYFGLQSVLLPYLVMMCGFIVATFVDFEHRIIPDEVSIGGMIVGVIFSLLIPQLHGQTTFWQGALWSLIGLLVGGGSIYLMGMLGDVLFKKESMGGGDVKLMGMVGAFMGWKYALLTFFLAPFFGAIYGLAEKIRTKESTIAYGPFLVFGALLCLFKGETILRWVLHNYGITY